MLQQTTTFRPFPGVLIAFAFIARLTSDHQVINAIAGKRTRNGERMINMVLSPFHFVMAIVALTFLPIVLLSDLWGGMFARNTKLLGLPVPVSCAKDRSIGYIILMVLSFSRLLMLSIRCTIIGQTLLTLRRIICASTSINSLFILLPIGSTTGIVYLWVTMIALSSLCVIALFAKSAQTFIAASKEKVSSSRKRLTTGAFTLLLRDLLGYSVTHGTSQLLVSRSGDASNIPGHTTLLPPQYTTNPPVKQLHAKKGGLR